MFNYRERFDEIYDSGQDQCWSESVIPQEFGVLLSRVKQMGILNLSSPVMDLGCGRGRLISYTESNGFNNITGVDISDVALRSARTKSHTYHLVLADVNEGLPFLDNHFSLVTELTLLSSLNPIFWPKIFSEIKRVLKKDGHLISQIFVRDNSNSPSNNLYEPLVTRSAIPRELDQVYGVTETELCEIFGKYFQVIDYIPKVPALDGSFFVLARNSK